MPLATPRAPGPSRCHEQTTDERARGHGTRRRACNNVPSPTSHDHTKPAPRVGDHPCADGTLVRPPANGLEARRLRPMCKHILSVAAASYAKRGGKPTDPICIALAKGPQDAQGETRPGSKPAMMSAQNTQGHLPWTEGGRVGKEMALATVASKIPGSVEQFRYHQTPVTPHPPFQRILWGGGGGTTLWCH